MAFDKKAYNRAYYQKNKDLWQTKYNDGPIGRTGTPNPNYVTSISKSRDSRYGAYGQSKAAEEARKRTTFGMNSRYGEYSRERARQEISKNALGRFRNVQNGHKIIDSDYRRKALPQAGQDELRKYVVPRDKKYGQFRYKESEQLKSGNKQSKGPRRSREYEENLAFNSKKNVYPEGMTAANVAKAAKNGATGIGGKVAKAAKDIRKKYVVSMLARNAANRYKKGVAHDVRDSLERLKALDKYVGKEKKAKTAINKAQKARKKVSKFIKNLFG